MENNQPKNTMIKQLLRETLTLLCKNSLIYKTELSIEGLLGLTVDKSEIILVSISETINQSATDFEAQHHTSTDSQPATNCSGFLSTGGAKARKKKTNRAANICKELAETDCCIANGNIQDAKSMLPGIDRGSGESMRFQVNFDFERIEVKEEEEESCVRYDQGNEVSLVEDGQIQTGSIAGREFDNDCFFTEPPSGDSGVTPDNTAEQSGPCHMQTDLEVLEQNVDNFMSVDQKVLQEMFQTDFSARALSYNVEGYSGQEFQAVGEAQLPRRRTFSKADGPRTSSIHRRGYRFHCRYGYSRILHQCMQCSATFTMSSNLGRHMATMHSVNGDGQSTFCPICQKKFSRSDNLARHLKQVHKNVSSQVPQDIIPPDAPDL